MNIIQDIITIYKPYYNDEDKKVLTGPEGKLFFDTQEHVIDIGGSLITIYAETGKERATKSVDPVRIVLFLKKDSKTELTIFPKSKFNAIKDLIIPGKSIKVHRSIRNKFSFSGNERLITKLNSDRLFIENLRNEHVYIVIDKNTSQNILLTPAYGITSMVQFEKFVAILKTIENAISPNHKP